MQPAAVNLIDRNFTVIHASTPDGKLSPKCCAVRCRWLIDEYKP